MEAQKAIDIIKRMNKGDPTPEQKEALKEAYAALEKKVSKRSTGKNDISGQEVFEGDVIESHLGGQLLSESLVIKYGTYQAYCPVDNCYMDSVGFYASGRNLPDMPIGPLEDYAKVIGNVSDNPELVNW
jgi:hypothetical protein